jgi:hypothetical protein
MALKGICFQNFTHTAISYTRSLRLRWTICTPIPRKNVCATRGCISAVGRDAFRAAVSTLQDGQHGKDRARRRAGLGQGCGRAAGQAGLWQGCISPWPIAVLTSSEGRRMLSGWSRCNHVEVAASAPARGNLEARLRWQLQRFSCLPGAEGAIGGSCRLTRLGEERQDFQS